MNNPNNESDLILSTENKLQVGPVIIPTSYSANLDIDLTKYEPYTAEMYKEDQELIDSIYEIECLAEEEYYNDLVDTFMGVD